MRHSHTNHDLSRALKSRRWRLTLQRGVVWSLRGLAGGMGIAVILLIVAHFIPWPGVLLGVGASLTAGLATGLAYGLVTRPSLLETARRIDRLIGLSDRLSTAWELRQVETPFAWLQRRDALDALKGHPPGEAIRLWPGQRTFTLLLTGLALIGLLVALPNPMDRLIREREEFQQQLARAMEEVREAREELAETTVPLSAEERAALKEALAKLEEALKDAEEAPEALAALSRAEEEIRKVDDLKASQEQTLKRVGEALAASPATRTLGQALMSGDEAALRQALEALAELLGGMSPEELQELASALQQAANAAEEDEVLAGALRSAARAVASGEAGRSSAALNDLQDRLAALQDGAASQRALAQTMASLRNARSFLSGLASVPARPGSGGNGSQGTDGGTGIGSEDGDDGQGTGGGTDIGSGGGVGGSSAGDQPGARQGEQTGQLGAEGETVFVPGRGLDVPAEVWSGPGAESASGVLRPYREVIGEYARQAREHMERSPIPLGYKDLVQRYFAELED